MKEILFLKEFSLWEHQKNALTKIVEYIEYCQNENDFLKSALVHMPTGSGKSGVIAVISRFYNKISNVLILSPRVALRDQLYLDIQGRFFDILKKKPKNLPKKIKKIENSREIPDFDDNEIVLVSTIQMVEYMNRKAIRKLKNLVKNVSLIILDEGHYEPAVTWSQAVRNFNCPKILFSATPFRNDLKLFDININFTFSFTLLEATELNYLRSVEFEHSIHHRSPVEFVNQIISFYDEKIKIVKKGSLNPKMIIKCDNFQSICEISKILKDHGRNCISIHEKFEDNSKNKWERKTIPKDPKSDKSIFWIHQYKLLEGIDDFRFQFLAFYDPINDARSLVQQIGRIIRNPSFDSEIKCYVLDNHNGHHKALWDGFIEYDKRIKREGISALNLSIGEGFFPKFLDNQPIAYIDRKFRYNFNFDAIDPMNDIQLPLQINFLSKNKKFIFEKFLKFIHASLKSKDTRSKLFKIGTKCSVFIYLSYNNSKFLKYSCFLECHLGVIVIKDYQYYIAYYDNSGKVPLGEHEIGIKGAIKSEKLKKLVLEGAKAFITELSLNNTNLGINTFRSKKYNAASINEMPPALDDHFQYLTTFKGINYKKDENDEEIPIRKYVGISRGRISQSSKYVSLHQYLKWLEELDKKFKEDVEISRFFNRYALESNEPRYKEPKNILLDLQEIEDFFFLNDLKLKSKDPLIVENLCQNVSSGIFSITANNKEFKINIEYNKEKKKYILKSRDLDSYFYSEHEDYKGIISYLNKSQSFRIIPRSSGKIYAKYRFFSPRIQYGSKYSKDDSIFNHILVSVPLLKTISSEKGKKCKLDNSGWDNDSLFHVIDNMGVIINLEQYFGNPDIVICSDMNTEIADFILCDTKLNKVIMIHAKGDSSLHPYSASKLQDVCGQVMKNVKYLSSINNDNPPNINIWDKMWSAHPKTKGNTHRIRRGNDTPINLWKKIKNIIKNPNSDKEVWIFLGKILSKSEFIHNLYKSRPVPEAIQAAYLIHTALESVGKIGTKFYIFCYP